MNRVLLLVDAEVRLVRGLLDEHGYEVFMYLQQFGCSGQTSDVAVQHVKDYISQEWGSNIKTVEYTVSEVEMESVKKEVFEEYGECLLQCPLCDGIWWRCGHAWYFDSCIKRWSKRALGFVLRWIMNVKVVFKATSKISAVFCRAIWHFLRSVGVPVSFSRMGMAELALSSLPSDRHAHRGAAYFALGARRGDPVCMSNLGASYAKGLGAPRILSVPCTGIGGLRQETARPVCIISPIASVREKGWLRIPRRRMI